jgi:hypothetical protein
MADSPEQPAEPEAKQAQPDYSKMTDEELEQRLADGEGVIYEQEDAPETEVEATEPEPTDSEPTEEKAEPAEAPTEPAEPPVTEEEPEFDERQSQLEEMRLQLQLAEQQRKHFEALQSRAFSEKEAQRQQLEAQMQQLLSQQHGPQREDYDGGYAPPVQPQAQPPDSLAREVAEMRAEMKARAVQDEYANFLRDNPEAENALDAMAPRLQTALEPYKNMPDISPANLRQILRMALDSSWIEHRLTDLRKKREEALKRKVEQVPKKRQAKQAATVSGPGGAPAPKARPKQPEEMTAEEADRALVKEFGDGHFRRTRR